MRDGMHVLDVLRERGYVPQEGAAPGESWFDLAVRAEPAQLREFGHTPVVATVRAVLSVSEHWGWIHLFAGRGACVQSMRFMNAAGAVFLATLDATEAEARTMAGQDVSRGRRHSPGWAGTGYSGHTEWDDMPTTGGSGAGRD